MLGDTLVGGASTCWPSPPAAGRLRLARQPRSRWLFVGARVVEGIGGAAVLACGLALLAHQFPPGPARVHATSVWGASVGLGIAAGAVLTALLDGWTGWRETYVVTAVAAVGCWSRDPGSCPSRRPLSRAGSTSPGSHSVAGLTLLVSARPRAATAWTRRPRSSRRSAPWALVGLVVVEARVPEPLLDRGLLRNSRFRSATTGSLASAPG